MAYVLATFGFAIFMMWQMKYLNPSHSKLIVIGMKIAFVGGAYMVIGPLLANLMGLQEVAFSNLNILIGIIVGCYSALMLLQLRQMDSVVLLFSTIPLFTAMVILAAQKDPPQDEQSQ